MSIERVRLIFRAAGREKDIKEFDVSSATVELAAQALHTSPARIAKSLAFSGNGPGVIVVVTAGDYKIDNRKFKFCFGLKAKMLSAEETLELTGHAIGGVCPFAIENPQAEIYLDVSLRRFQTIFPACGSSNSAIELTPEELEKFSCCHGWVDVCKAAPL